MAAGVLSAGHARALLAVEDSEEQDRLALRIVAEGLSVRAVEEIGAKWEHALTHPLPPVLVPSGACQEVVHHGATLMEHGGLDEFPIPISTPGFDNAPYLTAAHVLTKDPVTGLRNLGNYRCMLKAPDRVGCLATIQFQDGGRHWRQVRAPTGTGPI